MTKEEPKQIKCYCGHTNYCYCSPLEEPKQKTLEEEYYNDFKMIKGENIIEAAKRFWKESKPNPIEMAMFGADWQQERMYNEEDMIEFAEFVATYHDKNKNVNGEMLHAKSKYDGAERTIDLLKEFKKK